MKAPRGFTLVEILVVMIIVGLLAGMAVLAIGSDPQRQLQQEAQRALTVLQLAADEALLEGQEYGLLMDKEGYQVVQFNEQTLLWETSPTPAFERYTLPNDINISIQSEGNSVDLSKLAKGASQQEEQSEASLKPALLLLSSGEITPFILNFNTNDLSKTFTLSSDGLAGIQLDSSNER